MTRSVFIFAVLGLHSLTLSELPTKTGTQRYHRNLEAIATGNHSHGGITKYILTCGPTNTAICTVSGPYGGLPKTSIYGALTIEDCLDACGQQGFNIAGVEYGQECCQFQTSPYLE